MSAPIKIVSIIDEHTRECLGGLVERNITGGDLIDELDRLAAARGYPAVLRCDNGVRAGLRGDGRLGPRTGRARLHPARASPGVTATSSRSTAGFATSA